MHYLWSQAAFHAIKFIIDTSILQLITGFTLSVNLYNLLRCKIFYFLVMQEKTKTVDDDVDNKMAQMVLFLNKSWKVHVLWKLRVVYEPWSNGQVGFFCLGFLSCMLWVQNGMLSHRSWKNASVFIKQWTWPRNKSNWKLICDGQLKIQL